MAQRVKDKICHLGSNDLHLGDCLELMKSIPEHSVQLILADLPYGTTYASWDSIIPMAELWWEYKRILHQKGAIVLTATQPFSSLLVTSNSKMYRCEWIWNKEHAANFANAKKQPLKQHETVLVFGHGQTTYNPQMVQGKPNHSHGKNPKPYKTDTLNIGTHGPDNLSGLKYPKTILNFPKHPSQVGLHPTQKPVSLFEYLVRTYSNPGDTVMDNVMGSGTTGIACINVGNRKFIGIERDPTYFEIAKSRIESAAASLLVAPASTDHSVSHAGGGGSRRTPRDDNFGDFGRIVRRESKFQPMEKRAWAA